MNKVHNIAFSGFRHGHIYGLLNLAKESDRVEVLGGWEDFEHKSSCWVDDEGCV